MSAEADVLIVGAGLAGLSAATRLRGAGLEVKVLEAQVGEAEFKSCCTARSPVG